MPHLRNSSPSRSFHTDEAIIILDIGNTYPQVNPSAALFLNAKNEGRRRLSINVPSRRGVYVSCRTARKTRWAGAGISDVHHVRTSVNSDMFTDRETEYTESILRPETRLELCDASTKW